MSFTRVSSLSALLCVSSQIVSIAEPVSQWTFTARINIIQSHGEISLPFSAAVGDIIEGTFTLDYGDPGVPYIEDYARLYPDQPLDLITASIGGVPLADAPSSFAHSAEVWNNSELHDGHDLFFMTYQTLLDPRYPGLEVSMSLSGSDQNGLTVSDLALPTEFELGDFGGLTFGLGIIDPEDLIPNYQLEARLISIQPVTEVVDTDGDGVLDDSDLCADTALGAVVDEQGCSIDQLVPCAGPLEGGEWKNHGEYVSSVAKVVEDFLSRGLITPQQKEATMQAAGQSPCGKP